jgi:hypothetical protein
MHDRFQELPLCRVVEYTLAKSGAIQLSCLIQNLRTELISEFFENPRPRLDEFAGYLICVEYWNFALREQVCNGAFAARDAAREGDQERL